MHPPLHRPHPLCQQVIELLESCHRENPTKKFFGECNKMKIAVDRCFKFEKERRRQMNYLRSRQDYEGMKAHECEDAKLRELAGGKNWVERFL